MSSRNFEESEDELREEVRDSMRNLFITVENRELQGTKELEKDRNTETCTPDALEQNQSQAEQGKNEAPVNREEGQHA